jgi:hypothetical protein
MWEEIGNFLKGLPGSSTGNLLAGIGGTLAQEQIAKDISALGQKRCNYCNLRSELFLKCHEGGLLGEIGRQVRV